MYCLAFRGIGQASCEYVPRGFIFIYDVGAVPNPGSIVKKLDW